MRRVKEEQQPIFGDLLTTEQIAREFKRCPRTISRWRKRGLLRCTKLGNRFLYSRQDILDSIRSQATASEKRAPQRTRISR